MGFNSAFKGLKLHFIFRQYQVNGFVLFGKVIAVHFDSAFPQLVYLPNVPIIVHCSSRRKAIQEDEAPRFQDNRHMKVVRLSALRTGRFHPPGNTPGTHFC